MNFFYKYGEYGDWCGAGRASGRETVGRVAGGAVAKQILAREGIEVLAHVIESHGIKGRSIAEGTMTFEEMKANYRKNDLNCCDLAAAEGMIADLLKVRQDGDTAGGAIEIVARGVPAGLGEPVFDKLKATIAHGLCSIGAMTGLEFGSGFEAAGMLGSQWNDQPFVEDGKVRFRTNRCGGFLGGMSNGEDLVMRMAVKPTPTISKEQDTVDMTTLKAEEAGGHHAARHQHLPADLPRGRGHGRHRRPGRPVSWPAPGTAWPGWTPSGKSSPSRATGASTPSSQPVGLVASSP